MAVKFGSLAVLKSKHDLRRGVILPSRLDAGLAEETGIHVGDGYLSSRKYETQIKWDYTISGGLDDEPYLRNYVSPLIQRLYGVKPGITKSVSGGTVRLFCYSEGLVRFKHSIGLPLGVKKKIGVPTCIRKSRYKTDFLRGLFDTDGCITFKRRYRRVMYYPSISLCAKSRRLILQVHRILSGIGITSSIVLNRRYESGWGKRHVINSIHIYGRRNLKKWLQKIGFSNPKNRKKIEEWTKNGFIKK